MKLKIKFLLILILCVQQFAMAQNYFKAVVKDSLTQMPLTGATVVQQGTSNGAVTDINGKVKLAINKTGNIPFVIQYVGYKSKTITVAIPQKDSLYPILLSTGGEDLEEVTITSVRTNSRIEDIPTRVEVLGLDDLKDENGVQPGNIMSLLGDIAGIQMQQVSASSGNTYARVQGLNGRYTQILKDGMPLYGGLSGSFGILQVPPLDLKQIEIIKGSCSTLYGGDAIGGIINLVSKDPGYKQELNFTANQTSLLETNLNAYAAKRFKAFGYTLFVGQTFQKQGDVDKDGLSDVPKVNSTVIHPKLLFYVSPKSTLTLNYTGTFDNREGGDMNYLKSDSPDTLYHVKSIIQRHSGDAKWLTKFSDNSNLTIKASSSFLTEDLQTKYYDFKANQLIYYSEISYFHQWKKINLVGGVNFNGDIFNNKSAFVSPVTNYNYQTTGAFVQATYNPIAKLTIEAGFREDYQNAFGYFPLPRLSVMYKFSKQFSARVNGGLGYKVPNLVTYIDPETDLNMMSPVGQLQAEHSQGINGDINYQKVFSDKLNVNVNQSFFYTNITTPVYDSSSTFSKVSIVNEPKPLQTKGLQTYVRVKYKELEIYASYVFTDVQKQFDALHPVPYVTPRDNFSAVVVYGFSEHFKAGIESSLIADQLNQDYQPVKNYFMFALMLQYNIQKFSIVLNGENLLNFRQGNYERIYDGTIYNPVFRQLWAPVDGRVINLSVSWKL